MTNVIHFAICGAAESFKKSERDYFDFSVTCDYLIDFYQKPGDMIASVFEPSPEKGANAQREIKRETYARY